MQRIRLVSLFTLLTIGLTVSATNVFSQQAPSGPTGLALEITYYPGRTPAYQNVPGSDSKPSGGWFGYFARTASWQAPAGAPPAEAVRIISRVEGDAVRVTASILSGSKAFENEQPVGTYLIRETGKITIEELKHFGIEPFEIKLIRVNPNVPLVPPVVLKGVESVVIINSMAKETTLPSYRIILRSQSNKNIVALRADIVAGGKIQTTFKPRGIDGQPLIPAGKEYWLTVAPPNRAQPTPGGYVPTSPSDQEIQIKAAVFEDGTYEGDAETAAIVGGYLAGEKMELPRLIPLLENALNSGDADLAKGLRQLDSQVSAVGSDAELGTIQSLTSKFPQGSDSAGKEIKIAIEFSATTIKSNLLKEIHTLQNEESKRLTEDLYRTWLIKTKERYEKWLARL
ncbi:MAG TPA: hypothetical protein DC054_12300 [Blastocatellia bacterium]|nr:hypothetical protein [Blastocatellia bacterium]